MRGISEERLRNIEKYYAARGISPMLPIGDLIRECQELNQWMTLEEFLKSGFEVLCWVQYANKKVTSLNYFNGRFLSTNTGHQVISNIIKVQPIHKPEPPR